VILRFQNSSRLHQINIKMGLEVLSSTDTVYPVVLTNVLEFAEGGGTLQKSALPTTQEELKEGTPVYLDTATKLVHVVKTATLQAQAAANATSIRVKKATPYDHPLIVGDFITNGKVSTAITGITTTETAYDTVALTATLDAKEVIPVSTVLFVAAAAGTASATASTATVEDIVAATLTLSDAHGLFNGITVTINANGSDALAVTYTASTKTLLIRLASTTANKNTAALIQAAIRALLVTGGYDFTEVTAAAGGTWDAAAVGGVLTVPTDYFAGGVLLADIAPTYTPNGVICGNYDITGENNAVSVVYRGTMREAVAPYAFTTAMKAALKGLIIFT